MVLHTLELQLGPDPPRPDPWSGEKEITATAKGLRDFCGQKEMKQRWLDHESAFRFSPDFIQDNLLPLYLAS